MQPDVDLVIMVVTMVTITIATDRCPIDATLRKKMGAALRLDDLLDDNLGPLSICRFRAG
jgi:hypothetical protein